MRRLLTIAITFGVLTTPALGQEKPQAEEELVRLAGVWKVVSMSGHGKVVTAAGNTGHDGKPLWEDSTFTIAGDRLTTKGEPVVLPEAKPDVGLYFALRQDPGEYRLKVTKAKGKGPGTLDFVVGQEMVLKGIYELKGDELKLCVVNWLSCKGKEEPDRARAAAAKARPTEFTTREGGEYVAYVLKRVKR